MSVETSEDSLEDGANRSCDSIKSAGLRVCDDLKQPATFATDAASGVLLIGVVRLTTSTGES
jgi:hypothetical protein